MTIRIAGFLIVLQFFCLVMHTSAEQPNIVVLLADDLGYGDVQPLNPQSKIPTPNFSRLATEGMSFTDAHSASAVCTPTRYSLLCGRYSWRTSMKRGVLGGYSRPLIEQGRQTIASILQQSGYETACIGKWHLGLGWVWHQQAPKDINNMGIAGGKPKQVDYTKPLTYSPNSVGFDYSFLVPASLDMSPYVYLRNNTVDQVPERVIQGSRFPAFFRKGEISDDFIMEEALDKLTEEACQFIRNSSTKDKPFFLYFPLTAPHKPVLPHPRFKDKTKLGIYGDFIHQVDWTLGQVMKTLDDLKLSKNTLLIVTSDNGSFMYRHPNKKDHLAESKVQGFHPDHHTSNGQWRGTKADIWEAGHRVPFFVRWPAKVDAGSRCNQTICQTDILATVAELTDATFDRISSEDSFSFDELLQGKERSKPRPPVIHQSGNGQLAIRDGAFKLILGNGSGGREKPKGQPFSKPFQLFNLDQDPSETKNLIDQNPALAEAMFAKFERISHGDHQSKK